MSTVDLKILEILIHCQVPPSAYRNFTGISQSQLRQFSINDLQSWLSTRLPSGQERPCLVTRFISNLFLQQEEDPQIAVNQPPVEETQKEVIVESADGDSDSDVVIMDEVVNVTILGAVDSQTKAKDRVLDLVTLENETPNEMSPKKPKTSNENTKQHAPAFEAAGLLSADKNEFKLGRPFVTCIGKEFEWTMDEFQELMSKSSTVKKLTILSNCDEDLVSCMFPSQIWFG